MKPKLDYTKLIGVRYSRLVVSQITGNRNSRYEMLILCQCDCGTDTTVPYPRLKSGNTKSCGCLQPDRASECNSAPKSHGMAYSGTYKAHRAMMRRCYEIGNIGYAHYGAKGITVCDRWLGVKNFPNFLADMGERPDGMTLDRFPNGLGNYGPDNCRWATPSQQSRNQITNRWITLGTETLILKDWANRFGISSTTILDRLSRGWTEADAITRPARQYKHNSHYEIAETVADNLIQL